VSCAKRLNRTDRFAVWVMHSGGLKDAHVQSYSPGGANVPSWEDTLPPPLKYDWTVHLQRRCTLCQISLTTLSLDTPTYTVAQLAERFEPNTVLWVYIWHNTAI